MSKVKLMNEYITTLHSNVSFSSTWEIAIHLNKEIESEMWFIVIDRDNDMKEERMFFHRKNGSVVYVYSVNRHSPKQHTAWANVILDYTWTINYLSDISFPQWYIYKIENNKAIITWWEFFINSQRVVINDLILDSQFQYWVVNNIYIKDNNYYVTSEERNDMYLIWKVHVSTNWNIDDIEMIRTLSIWDWLRQEERDKLASINPNAYEHKVNKTTDVRSYDESSDTLYPTEKAVAYQLDKKLDKVPWKQLSDQNFERWEKDFILQLKSLNLELIDFRKIHNLRTDLRDYLLASNTEAVSEKWIAKVLMWYVKAVDWKQLSTNDFTTRYKNIIDDLWRDRANFVLLDDVTQSIQWANPREDKVPSEKAVVNVLKNYVKKEWNKKLSDLNFSQEIYDKIIWLENRDKIKVIAWTWISVNDLWEDWYEISSAIETWKQVVWWNINIFPLDNAKVKYIDEQKYLILSDYQRTWFYWEATFKNGKKPKVKVYYNNPNNDWKILIDTHVRIIKTDGSISEHHKSVPYTVDCNKGHWMFELHPRSFMWLDYNNAEVIYIKVYRVWSYYTDKYGNEFNTVLNDTDTVKWDVRFKSMYINYEIDWIWWNSTNWFSWTLYDNNCNPIATLDNWVIVSVENWWDSTWYLSISTSVNISWFTDNRDLSQTVVDSDTVLSWLQTFVKDLKWLWVLRETQKQSIINKLNSLKVLNAKDDTLEELDWNTATINEVISFLSNLVTQLWDALNTSSPNDCGWKTLDLQPIDPSEQKVYDVTVTRELREIDIETATLEDYRDFVKTLIKDIKDTWLFTWEITDIWRIDYVVRNATWIDTINWVYSLEDLWNILFTLVRDIKKTNIV